MNERILQYGLIIIGLSAYVLARRSTVEDLEQFCFVD